MSDEVVVPATLRLPLTVRFPEKVALPEESIVSLATPFVTKDNWACTGLIIPVLMLLANLRAQLFRAPGESKQLVPSSRKSGNPPSVIAS